MELNIQEKVIIMVALKTLRDRYNQFINSMSNEKLNAYGNYIYYLKEIKHIEKLLKKMEENNDN